MVSLERIADDTEAAALIALLDYHEQMTHSDRAAALLWDSPGTLERIWRVTPHSADAQSHGAALAALHALDLALPVPAPRPAQRTTGT